MVSESVTTLLITSARFGKGSRDEICAAVHGVTVWWEVHK